MAPACHCLHSVLMSSCVHVASWITKAKTVHFYESATEGHPPPILPPLDYMGAKCVKKNKKNLYLNIRAHVYLLIKMRTYINQDLYIHAQIYPCPDLIHVET